MKITMVRRPIFNRHMEVEVYQLLFRPDDNDYFDNTNTDEATDKETFLLPGIDKITNHKKALVKFSPNLLKRDVAAQLPKQLITVEIFENMQPGKEIIETCLELKELGYLIAAGAFVLTPPYKPLIEHIDMIKVDFRTTGKELRSKGIEQVNDSRVKFLAENVETLAEFEQATAQGYYYMQGYFFCEINPTAKREPSSNRTQYFKIMSELTQPEIDYDRLESLIQHDVSFSYKLLKFINSSAFGFRTTISSIKQGLVLLGKREVMQWVSSLTLREVANNKPQEIVSLSVIRAKFGELLAAKAGLSSRSSDIFLMGIFSLLDALLDQPLNDILKELPIAADVKDALLGETNQLHDFQQLMLAYEKGDWIKTSEYAAQFHIAEQEIPELYITALQWADSFIRA